MAPTCSELCGEKKKPYIKTIQSILVDYRPTARKNTIEKIFRMKANINNEQTMDRERDTGKKKENSIATLTQAQQVIVACSRS